jgi:hypothetical protein
MTIADWALVISICSAMVSLAGFVWNVWSKFIYPKPRVSVSLQFMTMMVPSPHDKYSVTGGENEALSAKSRRNWLRLKPAATAVLNPLPRFPNYPGEFDVTTGPFAGGLPKKVEVGDQFAVYFVPDHAGLARDEIDRVGFSDTFGRTHWAPKKHLVEARKHIREACNKAGKVY